MSSIEDLRAELENARARVKASALTDEDIEHAKVLAELEEVRAEAQATERVQRERQGKALEAAARKVAGGKYLVRFFDLGGLLPDADPSTLPGAGILVVRSPPTSPVDALGNFTRELEAKARPIPDVYADLVCESVVCPNLEQGAEGAKLRAFFEGSLGRGTVTIVGDAVTDLAGVRVKATKRGRG